MISGRTAASSNQLLQRTVLVFMLFAVAKTATTHPAAEPRRSPDATPTRCQ